MSNIPWIFVFIFLTLHQNVCGYEIVLEEEVITMEEQEPVKNEEFLNWAKAHEPVAVKRILEKISSPDDNINQQRAKLAVAQFLVNVTLTAMAKRLGNVKVSKKSEVFQFPSTADLPFSPFSPMDVSQPASSSVPAAPLAPFSPQEVPQPESSSALPPPSLNESEELELLVLHNENQTFILVPISSPNMTESEESKSFLQMLGINLMLPPLPMLNNFTLPEFPGFNFTLPPPKERNDSVTMSQMMLGNQVEKLVEDINKRNLTGIVDSTINIATPASIGVLVNQLLNLVLCNPVDRWNGQCGV